jgi:hypothetical protein
MVYDWNAVDPVRLDRIGKAEQTIARMNSGRDFYDWLTIGDGLKEWRDAACELAGTQDLDSPAYRAAWAAAKSNYPHLATVTQSERSQAVWMAENRAALEQWHAGLEPKEKRRYNHPRSIWRRSPLGQATKDAQRSVDNTRERKRKASDLDNVVRRIESVSDHIEKQVGGAEMFDLSPELIAESARNFVDIYGPESVKRFITELQAIIAPARPESAPFNDPAFEASLKRKPRRARLRKKVEDDSPTEPAETRRDHIAGMVNESLDPPRRSKKQRTNREPPGERHW